MNEEQLAAEARARIIWGHNPEEVLEWLQENGTPSAVADAIVKAGLAERAREVRGNGMRELAKGGALVLGAGLIAVAMFSLFERVPVRLLVPVFAGALYGLYLLLNGAISVLSGSSHGSVSGG